MACKEINSKKSFYSESDYWLNLLHDNGYLNDEKFKSLSNESTRIVKILTSIVKTMKAKIEGKNR